LADLPTGGAVLIGFDAFGDVFEEDLGVTTGVSLFLFTTGSGLAISGFSMPLKFVGCALAAICSWL
jgi:hypothetical protein